jgi:hypothetical protein
VTGTPGDFNENGSVDAADYVAWRKNLSTENPLPNDSGLGTPIGPDHYNLWRANFGGTPAGIGSSVSQVPECASATLWLIGAAYLSVRQRSMRLTWNVDPGRSAMTFFKFPIGTA